MTIKSYPWQGVVGDADTGVDAGYYEAPEWWAVWAAMMRAGGLIVAGASPLRTQSAWASIGVFYGVPNRLAVTDAGGLVCEVDTGAALIDGQLVYNDAAYQMTLPANQTSWYVVLRKNYTNATYTPVGYVAGNGTVPAYTTRPTWVSALTQDTTRATYWDIPLFQFTTGAATISSLTDVREWVDAEDKQFWVQATRTKNETDATEPLVYNERGWITPAAKDCAINGDFVVPKDFISTMTVEANLRPVGLAAGNAYIELAASYGQDGETWLNHQNAYGPAATAVSSPGAAESNNVVGSVSLASAAVDDIVTLELNRFASNILDTVSGTGVVYVNGFWVKYFGWR